MYRPEKPYIKEILSQIKKTWYTPFVSIAEGGIVYETESVDFPKYQHVDGVGTKGVYHWLLGSYREAAIDAFAMNWNDMMLMRARPYLVSDVIELPEENIDAIHKIVLHLAEESKKRAIAISGGETAIKDTIRGLEVILYMTGFIIDPLPNLFEVGDILLGLASSGLHSNGLTKIRELFSQPRPEFITPTIIYDSLLPIVRSPYVHGMAHITGGAFGKIKHFLPDDADFFMHRGHTLAPQEIFSEIYRLGVGDEEMYRTFNCGIGFVLGVDPEFVDTLRACVGFRTDVIGEVVRGEGRVRIESQFSPRTVIYE